MLANCMHPPSSSGRARRAWPQFGGGGLDQLAGSIEREGAADLMARIACMRARRKKRCGLFSRGSEVRGDLI
jgi:hypothetical protein